MANLLGDLWADGEPDWAAACRQPDVKLHLYGKVTPKPGRKMGHLTAMGRTVARGAGPRDCRARRAPALRCGLQTVLAAVTRFQFGDFELDAAAGRLTHAGTAVTLPARHLDVLAALLAHAGQVVSKDALVEAAWRDVAVTDNSLEQAISSLRRALGGGQRCLDRDRAASGLPLRR